MVFTGKIWKILFNRKLDRKHIRHIIINKALCIQGKCLSCSNKDLNSDSYLEIKGMCKQITDAASKL